MNAVFALVSELPFGFGDIRLWPGAFVIGRSPHCDVMLTTGRCPAIMRTSFVTDADVTVTEAGSRNGTFVNSQRIDVAARVIPGDYLQFGRVRFQLKKLTALQHRPDLEGSTASCASDDVSILCGQLSRAQRRVFELLLKGHSEKQIGFQLELSRHTIHNHVRAIYRAFRVHSRSELLARLLPGHREPDGPPSP